MNKQYQVIQKSTGKVVFTGSFADCRYDITQRVGNQNEFEIVAVED